MPPRLSRLLAAFGLLLQFALWFALGAGALRLLRLFLATVGETDEAAATDQINEGAAIALLLVQTGQLLALSGLGLMAVAVWLGPLRDRWIYWGEIVALAAWIPLTPFGPFLGVGGIAALVLNRRHFLRPPDGSGAPH